MNRRQNRKTVACRRCHAQKIKCNGDKPCGNCLQSNNSGECIYPIKNRKVTVTESYIKHLEEENTRLHQGGSSSATQTVESYDNDRETSSQTETSNSDRNSAINPLVEAEAWFVPYETAPLYVGEAACTAFASRFRQFLLNTQAETHIPRTQYIKDVQVYAAYQNDEQWPSRPHAFLLLETALATVGRCYHLGSSSALRESLENAYRNLHLVDQLSKFEQPGIVPGLSYFAKATHLLRLLPERATLDHVVCLVLFMLCSLVLNRRHSAYCFIGDAIRLGATLGLHQNIRKSQLLDNPARQLRVRTWWTIYVLDRMMGSKVGYPISVQDDDIGVDLPSDEGMTAAQRNDIVSSDYLVASIGLAKITAGIISTLYSRKRLSETFSQRVQKVFKDLTSWIETLPGGLQLHPEQASNQSARNVVSLHLAFNQSVVLATRPILLHVFRVSNNTSGGNSDSDIPQATHALAKTCVQSARHSYRLLAQSWIDGSLAALDYLSAQYLFAASTVLAISSLSMHSDSAADKNDLQSAVHLLHQLRRAGNVAAGEFCEQIEAVLQCISTVEGSRQVAVTVSEPNLHGFTPSSSNFPIHRDSTNPTIFGPVVQDFLSQVDTELGLQFPLDDDGFGFLNEPLPWPPGAD